MGVVELKGMQFHSYHGCLDSERRDGNEFLVDVSFEYDMSKACQSDRLEDAFDYSLIYNVVREEMGVPSNLLENVAWRIKSHLESSFPALSNLSVTVSKKNPPVGGCVDWACVRV